MNSMRIIGQQPLGEIHQHRRRRAPDVMAIIAEGIVAAHAALPFGLVFCAVRRIEQEASGTSKISATSAALGASTKPSLSRPTTGRIA